MRSYSGDGSQRDWQAKQFLCILTLALLLFFPCAASATQYGATGPYKVVSETFENPMWPLSDGGTPVTVLLPSGHPGPAPVMFFSHGLGGTAWSGYRSMLQNVCSWGVVVVFSPYPTSLDWSSQYEILWYGFQEATDLYAAEFDLSRVGFAGHSWGGGATPNMALRGVEAGWGDQGLFMFIMAPAPASGVSDAELRSLSHAKLIMQVYENDTICPHSWAQSTYDKVGTAEKAYYYVYGGDHFTPTERGAFSDLGRRAVWEPLDALIDYTFELERPYDGMMYALYGQGGHYETDVTGITGQPPADLPSGGSVGNPPADPPSGGSVDNPPADPPSGGSVDNPPADPPTNTSYNSRWSSWFGQWFNRYSSSSNVPDVEQPEEPVVEEPVIEEPTVEEPVVEEPSSSSSRTSIWTRWLDRYQSFWR